MKNPPILNPYLSILAAMSLVGAWFVPNMVEIHSKAAIPVSDKLIKMRGKLVLNESGDSRSEIFVMEAEIVK